MTHNIQLFVEDELNEAYKILAQRAIGSKVGCRIRASRMRADELGDCETLLDLVKRSQRSGCHQVIFAIDHEGPQADIGRVETRQRFREAFKCLCDYLDDLPHTDPLKQMNVVRIEVCSCLESWLLSDPQAIIRRFSGPSTYCPPSHHTDHLTPEQARNQIAHIIREIGRRTGKQRLSRMGAHAIKSEGSEIAQHLDLSHACRYNTSLAYFYDVLANRRNGCQHPWSE